MNIKWDKIEDNSSRAIRLVRVVLLVLIIIGVGLLVTKDTWVP